MPKVLNSERKQLGTASKRRHFRVNTKAATESQTASNLPSSFSLPRMSRLTLGHKLSISKDPASTSRIRGGRRRRKESGRVEATLKSTSTQKTEAIACDNLSFDTDSKQPVNATNSVLREHNNVENDFRILPESLSPKKLFTKDQQAAATAHPMQSSPRSPKTTISAKQTSPQRRSPRLAMVSGSTIANSPLRRSPRLEHNQTTTTCSTPLSVSPKPQKRQRIRVDTDNEQPTRKQKAATPPPQQHDQSTKSFTDKRGSRVTRRSRGTPFKDAAFVPQQRSRQSSCQWCRKRKQDGTKRTGVGSAICGPLEYPNGVPSLFWWRSRTSSRTKSSQPGLFQYLTPD